MFSFYVYAIRQILYCRYGDKMLRHAIPRTFEQHILVKLTWQCPIYDLMTLNNVVFTRIEEYF